MCSASAFCYPANHLTAAFLSEDPRGFLERLSWRDLGLTSRFRVVPEADLTCLLEADPCCRSSHVRSAEVDQGGRETICFRSYEATRVDRAGSVQRISIENSWMRGPTDTDWLYCYDACTAPLAVPRPMAA